MSTSENIHIIGQGTYGCVYKPHFDCKTYKPKSGESNNFLSKIQLENNITENEIKIGKLVKSIPRSRNYFAAIEEDCTITIGKINEAGIEKCKMLEKFEKDAHPKSKLKSTKISYAGKKTLTQYLESELINTKKDNSTNVDNYLKKIANTHLYLLESVQLLIDKKIIHMDIKHNNIIYNGRFPIIIDFGISYDGNNLSLENYKKTKRAFGIKAPFYMPWCFEIVLLSNVSHDVLKHNPQDLERTMSTRLSQEDILYLKKIVEEYVKMHVLLQNTNLFTDEERKKYIEKLNDYTNMFIGKTWGEVWIIITNSNNTWDNYSISIMYLLELKISGLVDVSKSSQSNHFLKTYLDTIKKNILSGPQERQSPSVTLAQLKTIFGKIKKQEYNDLKSSIKITVQENKEKMIEERAKVNTNTLNEEAVMVKKYNNVVQEKRKD